MATLLPLHDLLDAVICYSTLSFPSHLKSDISTIMDTKRSTRRRRDDLLRRIRREPGLPAEDKSEPPSPPDTLPLKFPVKESGGPSNPEEKSHHEKSRLSKEGPPVRRCTSSHETRKMLMCL